MGLVQLKKLKNLNKIRQKNAKIYFDELVCDRKLGFDRTGVYHFYWILIKNRDKLRKILLDKGIETGTHYRPIHKFTMYDKKISLPNTEYAGKSIVTLPTHPNLTQNDLDQIIKTINRFERN
jgi:dTDP-4-amino-4,6-dideoxygalactose transaminase